MNVKRMLIIGALVTIGGLIIYNWTIGIGFILGMLISKYIL